jgi:hypothetical protein
MNIAEIGFGAWSTKRPFGRSTNPSGISGESVALGWSKLIKVNY